MVNDKKCYQKEQNKTLMFCSNSRACLRSSSLILLRVKRISSAWNLSFRRYSSSTWSSLQALTAKYLKVLQVFEDTTGSCDRMSTCIIVRQCPSMGYRKMTGRRHRVSPCRSAYFASPWWLLTLDLRRRSREAALLFLES